MIPQNRKLVIMIWNLLLVGSLFLVGGCSTGRCLNDDMSVERSSVVDKIKEIDAWMTQHMW